MASYTPLDNRIPRKQRIQLVASVGVGDQVDLRDAVGGYFPKNVAIFLDQTTDVIEYKLNHAIRDEDGNITSYVTSPTFENSGAQINLGLTDVEYSAFELVSYSTTGASTTIELVVW